MSEMSETIRRFPMSLPSGLTTDEVADELESLSAEGGIKTRALDVACRELNNWAGYVADHGIGHSALESIGRTLDQCRNARYGGLSSDPWPELDSVSGSRTDWEQDAGPDHIPYRPPVDSSQGVEAMVCDECRKVIYSATDPCTCTDSGQNTGSSEGENLVRDSGLKTRDSLAADSRQPTSRPLCNCADPENCTEEAPGRTCKRLWLAVCRTAEKRRY